MRKLAGVLVAGAFLVGFAGAASAEDEGPNFTFGASTSYVYDFNDPDDNEVSGINSLSYSNFEARDESFNIDLVQLGINGTRGRASYGAKIDYGDLAWLAGDSSDGDIALQTAYLTYDFDGAAVTAGRFDTPIGYEVMEPWGNANVSRSYTWSQLQPINHDGLFVSGSVDVIDAMIGAVNGFTVNDNADLLGGNDTDDEKGVVAAVGAGISDALNLYFAALYTEDFDVVDRQAYNAILSGNVDMNGNGVRYAIEGNYRNDDQDEGDPTFQGETDAWSIVLYGGTDFGPTSLDVRGEWLDLEFDPEGGSSVDNRIWSVTVTAGWYLTDGLQLRLEYRHDDSDDHDVTGFDDDDCGAGIGGCEDTLDTLQAQVVWYPEL